MRQTASVAIAALLLAACMPAPASNGAPMGPSLVIDVRNSSNRQLEVEYEFEAGGTSGSGAGIIGPCQQQPMQVGQIGGTYVIRVDGKSVLEATVPLSAPLDAWMVINVSVDPDGMVEVSPGGFAQAPHLDTVPIPCG
jgi:hypothetical protein